MLIELTAPARGLHVLTSQLKMSLQQRSKFIYLATIWLQIVAAINLVQPINCAQLEPFSQVPKTADLSLLINETLSINNKAPADPSRLPVKDDWTFDRVEYDLMEFLQDLSARYSNSTNRRAPVQPDDTLEGKCQPATDQSASAAKTLSDDSKNMTATSSAPTTLRPENPSTRLNALDGARETHSLHDSLHGSQSQAPTRQTSPKGPPTPLPNLSTSLASGDHDIAESSWQYGIFDRFTRPKTTSTTTTKEPNLVFDSSGRIDMRNFNYQDCGLRTYEDPQPQYFQDAFEAEASKELNQRRQRPPTDNKYESPADYLSSSSSNEDESSEGYDSYRPNSESEAQPPSGEHNSADNEFNLASRRHWLQQQLGNTLQLLGFNNTYNHSGPDIHQSYGLNANIRENMMKKSGKLDKAAKSIIDINSPGEALLARQDDLKLEARVIGGSDARLGDSPWSVSLQALVSKPGTVGVEYRHYCGGTIISEYYVLTAAHCLDFMVGRESRLFVVIGDLNWRMNAASLHGRRFGIEKLIIHSGYKSTAFGHDIGLIKTKESMKPLKVNGKFIVNSVCLPERGVEHTGEAELVGWGLFSNRNEMADTLQVADVPILPRPLCVDLYKRRTGLIQWLIGIELITDKQVCAGTFGRGICQGDSGSALVVNEKLPKRGSRQISKILRGPASSMNREQSRATIIGIVAFGGIRRCSYQSLPGVYMQTSKYMDWILPRIQD